MEALCNHLMDEHNVKSVLYIAGTKDHPDSALRQSVIKEAMDARNLPFTEENIFYSNWEPHMKSI